jgi:hypothetical protein
VVRAAIAAASRTVSGKLQPSHGQRETRRLDRDTESAVIRAIFPALCYAAANDRQVCVLTLPCRFAGRDDCAFASSSMHRDEYAGAASVRARMLQEQDMLQDLASAYGAGVSAAGQGGA